MLKHAPVPGDATPRDHERSGRSARRLCLAFLRSQGGIAATEFALLLPVFILLYVGTGELAQAVMTSRRVEELSRTLVDLTARQPTSGQTTSTPAPTNATTQSNLKDILSAATALLAPLPLTTLQMTISAVDITNDANGSCCVATVRWSYTQNGVLRPCDTALTTIPADQRPSPTSIPQTMLPASNTPLPYPIPILVADVSYVLAVPFAPQWLTLPNLQRTSYMRPRSVGQVVVGAPLDSVGGQSGAICY